MTSSDLWAATAGERHHPHVVLIHGAMDRSAGMMRLSRRLADDHFVVRYDRRGYGASHPHVGPFTIETNVADVRDLVERVRLDAKVMLVGHSYGGNVALAFAARYPSAVSGVVVYESPMSWTSWWPGSTAGAAAMTATDNAAAGEAFMRRMVGDRRWESLPTATQAARRAEGATMVAELTDLRHNVPWAAADLVVPIVAGYGSESRPHHRQAMVWLADQVPTARAVELAGARHDAPARHPDAFRTELVDRLKTG